ncbi:LPXTG cell wall anchor domain-containing protein, partial [Enterococcus faecalis]|uniref:LPXTG cell wall anchor domain-containing protein n=1 Tax=Enterococcus faecalis TaxID=1351 RepID=UPI0039854738
PTINPSKEGDKVITGTGIPGDKIELINKQVSVNKFPKTGSENSLTLVIFGIMIVSSFGLILYQKKRS